MKKVRFLILMLLLLGSFFGLSSCKKTQNVTTKPSGTNSETGGEDGYDFSNRGATTVYFHYLRYRGDYTGWYVWSWPFKPTNSSGKAYNFATDTSEEGLGGSVASVPVAKNVSMIGFLVAYNDGSSPWADKDIAADRYVTIPENANENTPVHVYVLEALADFTVNEKPVVKDRIVASSFKDENTIIADATTSFKADTIKVYKDGSEISIASRSLSQDKMSATVTLSSQVNYDSEYEIYAKFGDDESKVSVTFDGLYDYAGFQNAFNYSGDLGVIIKDNKTTFRVWAPVSTACKLNLYSVGTTGGDSSKKHPGTDIPDETIEMTKGEKGTWSYTADSNLHGTYYTFTVTTGGVETEVVDPYAYACGVNGKRGLVVDFTKINPEGWQYNKRANVISKNNDAIIYEMHVRDMTASDTWNGSKKVGTFSALAETGTTYTENGVTVTTGFDHIKELGVNTVQILPFFDWSDDVDETQMNNNGVSHYSWGYMPLNYNCLEGSYSEDPYDGLERIVEFKEMVMAYTEAGIRINMDVVYNHIANAASSSFNQIVPNYYFRTDANGNFTNGSGCGNETASERYMFSKFMVDSVAFWAYEYNLSGFRFDLMGLHDLTTMNNIAAKVKTLDPTIMIYGEPWTGGSTPLDGSRQAKTENIAQMPNVGTFNDSFRDAVKGNVSDLTGWGWVQGSAGNNDEFFNKVKAGISGHIIWSGTDMGSPQQAINYVACHDNQTLHDKLDSTRHGDNLKWAPSDLLAMQKQSYALVLLSQGVSFILNGDEFMRTKTKSDGSYDTDSVHSGDSVNAINWSYKIKYASLYNYVKDLITLRKNHPSFRLSSSADIAASIDFKDWGNGWVTFTINNSKSNDSYKNILVVMTNAKESYSSVDISGIPGSWKQVFGDGGLVNSQFATTKFPSTKNGAYVFYSA